MPQSSYRQHKEIKHRVSTTLGYETGLLQYPRGPRAERLGGAVSVARSVDSATRSRANRLGRFLAQRGLDRCGGRARAGPGALNLG